MANPNRKKRTKEEWDKLTEQAAKNAAKRMQEKKQEQEKEKAKKLTEGRARYNAAGEKNPSKKITAAQAKEAAQDPTSAGAKAIREKVLADMKAQKQAARRKEYAAQQAAARAKEAFSLPLPSATAAKKQETKTGQSPGGALGDRLAEGTRAEKDKDTTGKNPTRAGTQKQAAADFNAPLAQMGRNSTSWSMLREGKDAAKKAKWPEAAVGKMTVKQNALHQKNVEIAKPYDITFDAQKGVWRGGDSYGEWKGAQVYDAKKALPLPGSTASDMVAGARKVRETAGQFQPNPAVPAAQAAENRAKGAQRAKDTLMWPVHQTMAAIGGVSGSLYDTANMALETTGIDKFLPDAVKNWVTKNAQLGHGVQEQVRAVNYERGGKLGGAVGDLAQLGVEMLGQYALAAATGGASAGAQLGAKTGMVSKALETIAKSPNFWYSFVRTAGPEYEEAKANGASGPQAASAAILSALGQAGVEMGGGVETLAGKAAGGVKGAVKSMLEEGGEEAVQDLISGLAHKGVYDKGRGWFGSGDSGAVVNPQRMAGEFAMGALGASLPVGVNALMNRGKTYSLPLPDARDAALPETGKQGLPLPDVRQEATSIDTNPETHTPEQMVQIGEYVDSVDEGLVDFIRKRRNGELWKKAFYNLGPVSERAKSDIRDLLGVDTTGYKVVFDVGTDEHIRHDHGENGTTDHSMQNIEDIARIPYIVQNYDRMIDLHDTTSKVNNRDNTHAPIVRLEKRVDGTFYVVEAIPDSSKKSINIVSAYFQKPKKQPTSGKLSATNGLDLLPSDGVALDGTVTQAPHAEALGTTSETPLASPSSVLNQSMPQAGAEVKGQEIPDPGILRQTPWKEGETKPRLGGERETRPETARRLTQEEEYEIGKQLDDYLEQQEALRDKLESDLAAARRVLPTPGSEARIRELQSGFEDVNRTLAAMEKNRAQFAQAEETARALGAKFEIADIGEANGKYENGTIIMNPYTENPARQVLVHELTHHIETSGQYDALQSRVLEFIGQDMQTDVNAMLEAVTRDYAARGVTLTQDGARRELVAKFCEEKLFTDEKSIERLARTEPGLFQRIREWISDTIAKLRGTRQENALREMERLYEKAARSTGEQAGYQGAQYSIETDANGDKFVDVTDDILEGKTEKDHAQILRDIIRNKFGNIIQANGQIFAVNSKTSSEWRRSKSASSLYQKNNSAYLDKIRVFNNADELMSASHDYVGEGLKHPRKDRFVEFARGKVNYRVGNNGYTADIVVGIGIDGRADLYDIVNIRDKKITEARILPVTEELTSSPIGGASVNISIPQTGQDGNPSGQNPAPELKGIARQREYREAVERGDLARAQELLREKAGRKGYTGYDTAAERQNHIIQAANSATDDYHTWIRGADEVKSFAQTLDDPDWAGVDFDPDYTWEMAQDALRSGEITVYSSYPVGTPGGFVTPSRMEAEGYAGDGEVYQGTVKLDDVAWIDPTQGQYAPAQAGDLYKAGSANPKTLDITYDNGGKLIPLSQRFDETNPDRRYSMGMTFGQLRDSVNGALGQQGAQTGPAKGLPLPDSAAKAQGQLDALASDSYQIPDIIRQEEAAVRRAENAEQAQGQLDALTSDSYRGPEAEGQERMTLAEQMAEQARARGERIAANHPVRRATVRAEASPMDAHAPDAEAAIQTVNGLEGMRQALKRLERQFKLSKADLVTAKELSQGRRPTREVDADRLEKAETYAKLLREYESAMQPFYDYRTQLETARQEAADALLQDADNWKDVKLGASLSANTAERVFEIVAGKDGGKLIDSLARPVHEHDAQRNRWENGYRNRLRGIIKGTTREESHYTAMKNYAEYLERAGMDSSKLRTAMADYLQKNRKKIDMGRVETLENALIALTQEMHPEVNETRIRNGYTPLEFTARYLPALHRADEGGAAARVLRKMFGIETRADALPTEIAGTTANRRPGQPWQSFAMERTGDAGKFNPKDFDAVRAVDEYITGAGREIFFTDDIQNWRTFEERLRYRFSDEGTRAELDSIRTDPNLDAEQKLAEKTKLWERDQYSLPHFPTWLRKYADTLAGKKQLIDRAAEDELSRGFYRTVNDVEGKIAVNLTGFNISTALSNLVALQQGGAELSAPAMARAALDYAGELAGDTAFCERSVFLTNRKGTERIYKTGLQKVQDIGGKPAQWVDDFTSGILTRARYYDNIRRGMTDAQAMQDADGWAARVMGDRSTGARPLLFESKNPLVKVATMFQLEPANNFAHWFHDLPLEKGAAGAAAVLAKLFLTAYLFNDGVEKMTGNRPAPDAIGMVNDLVGRVAGWQLPNTFDLIAEAARGELDEEDFKTEKASPADAALETMQDIGSQIPYVSGPIGAAFGAGSTRFPIESAVPDITKMIQAGLGEGTTESKRAAIAKELAKPFLTIGMPTGGSQLSKTVRGVKTMLEGGAYGYDNDGNKTLKFPAYSGETTDAGKAARFAQAAIFGPYALKSAREYIESGYKGLNAKGTKAYQTLTGEYGVDQKTAADAVRAVTGTKAPEDGSLTGAQAKREAIMALDLTPEEKVELNRALVGGDDLVSFQDRDSFQITNTVAARNQPAAFALMREQGMDAAQAKKYAELVDDQGATYTLGKDQKITKTYEDGRQEERLLYTKDGKAARLKKAYETIQADESLTDGQKNGVVRAVVLSKLGKKYAGEYAEEFIGGIGVEQLIDAQAAYEDISEDVKKDTAIHENNRSEYVRLRFADYLENTGLDFLRRESLWYFQSHGESEFKEPWSEIIRKTTPSDEEERTRKQSALRGLQDSGMDESLFKVIKAGMGRVYADKDANGETIDGSAKKKKIAYLNKWEGLTDEQKDLIMKACGYKYGMGEKPKKGKSSSRKYPLALPTSFKLPKMKSLLPF